MVKQHSHCAIHVKDTITKIHSLDFIWCNFSKYVMKCALENVIPTKENTLDYILRETECHQDLTTASHVQTARKDDK